MQHPQDAQHPLHIFPLKLQIKQPYKKTTQPFQPLQLTKVARPKRIYQKPPISFQLHQKLSVLRPLPTRDSLKGLPEPTEDHTVVPVAVADEGRAAEAFLLKVFYWFLAAPEVVRP